MNHVYRVVWSASLGMYQVASEIACGHSGKSRSVDRRRARKAAAAAALAVLSGVAHAVPPYAGILTQSDNSGYALNPGTATGWFPVWDWNGTDLNVSMSGVKTVNFNNLTGQIAVGAGAAISGGTEGVAITADSVLSNQSGLTNNGTISATQTGVTVAGALGSIVNNGLISNGLFNAAAVQVSGTVGTLTNTGAIAGASDRGNGVSVAAADPAVPAKLNNIGNTGTISGGTNGISNTGGTIGTIANNVAGSATGTIKGQVGILNTTAYVGSTTVNGALDRVENSGVITGTDVGIANASTIGTIHNNASGVISGTGSYGVRNALGLISAIENSGSISGGVFGVQNLSTITSIDNAGVIAGNSVGVVNTSRMGTLTNTGAIQGKTTAAVANGVQNYGILGTLSNSGQILASSVAGNGSSGVYNANRIDSLSNASGGLIQSDLGVFNDGSGHSIGTLTNAGTIFGQSAGVRNLGGTITSIVNAGANGNAAAGTISGSGSGSQVHGIDNSGYLVGGTTFNATIGTITNGGLISGDTYGINNSYGTIGLISNLAGGTIFGGMAAIVSGTGGIGTINNAGVIQGDVVHLGMQDLTITGGTGSTYGTFMGSIMNANSNLRLSSGNIVLNEAVDLIGMRTLYNSGATLHLDGMIPVYGNYQQDAGGTLEVGVANGAVTTGNIQTDFGYGRLLVYGNATVAAGSTVSIKSMGYTLAAGQRFIVIDADTATYNAGALNYLVSNPTLTGSGAQLLINGRQDLVVTLLGPNYDATMGGPVWADCWHAHQRAVGLQLRRLEPRRHGHDVCHDRGQPRDDHEHGHPDRHLRVFGRWYGQYRQY